MTLLPDLATRLERLQTLTFAATDFAWLIYDEGHDDELNSAFNLLKAAGDESYHLAVQKRSGKAAGHLFMLLKLAAKRVAKADLPPEGKALLPLVKLARDEAKALRDALRPKPE